MANVLWIFAVGAISFVITSLIFLLFRKKECRNFSQWWDAEGFPIWMIAGVAVWALIDMTLHRFR
jgi:uncharacterized membrane protein YhhN